MTAKKRKIKCAYFTHVGLKLHTGELKWSIMMENIQIMTTINQSDSVTQRKS